MTTYFPLPGAKGTPVVSMADSPTAVDSESEHCPEAAWQPAHSWVTMKGLQILHSAYMLHILLSSRLLCSYGKNKFETVEAASF